MNENVAFWNISVSWRNGVVTIYGVCIGYVNPEKSYLRRSVSLPGGHTAILSRVPSRVQAPFVVLRPQSCNNVQRADAVDNVCRAGWLFSLCMHALLTAPCGRE